VAGSPSGQQLEVNEIVREAQEAAVAAVAPGVTGGEIDAVARRIVIEAGYETAFPHITGHALGWCYHEGFPMLMPGSSDVLQPGMVHSVEPGIYFEPMGGIRIEDDILVSDSGHEVLGPFPKELA
jgi:Xaa-Pro aminopeptidase